MDRHTDIHSVTANPSRYFRTPQEVVDDRSLTRKDKLDILHQWETDARLLAVAEEENLAGGEANQLGAVVNALISLGDETKASSRGRAPGAPTKFGN